MSVSLYKILLSTSTKEDSLHFCHPALSAIAILYLFFYSDDYKQHICLSLLLLSLLSTRSDITIIDAELCEFVRESFVLAERQRTQHVEQSEVKHRRWFCSLVECRNALTIDPLPTVVCQP